MKKFTLFVIIFTAVLSVNLAACSPQVTVTLLPPTATLVVESVETTPTPTLHPQFIALQESIAASGERFYLAPDGSINDGATPVKGIKVGAEGKITITVDGEQVEIDPSIMNFDDENGLSIEGFEDADGDGEWEVAVSQAELSAIKLLDQNGVDPETYTLTEVDGVAVATDNETGVEIMRGGRFEIGYAVDKIAKNSCEPNKELIPSSNGPILAESYPAAKEYFDTIVDELGYNIKSGKGVWYVLIDRELRCWGKIFNGGEDLLYRDKEGVAQRLPLAEYSVEEIEMFISSR